MNDFGPKDEEPMNDFPRDRFLAAGATEAEVDKLIADFEKLPSWEQFSTVRKYATLSTGDLTAQLEGKRSFGYFAEPEDAEDPEDGGEDGETENGSTPSSVEEPAFPEVEWAAAGADESEILKLREEFEAAEKDFRSTIVEYVHGLGDGLVAELEKLRADGHFGEVAPPAAN